MPIVLDGDVRVAPPVLPVVKVAPPGPTTVTVLPVTGPTGPAADTSTVRFTGTAAVVLSGHRAVTARPDGTIEYATNDDLDYLNAPIWITTGAASIGAPVEMVAFGPMTEGSWSWTPGLIYLGVNGALTQTPPAAPTALFLAQLGSATGATRMFMSRSPSISLI